MSFIDRIQALKQSYSAVACARRDHAFLLGTFAKTPPLARHIVFAPMPEAAKADLLRSYKRAFPADLLEIYSYMNGADLFWARHCIPKAKIEIPVKHLTVFGVPLSADREHLEPYNISVEDLNRPQDTPEAWLKFGSYALPHAPELRWDLFVDTDSGAVNAVESRIRECAVHKSWESIDRSLSELFDEINALYANPGHC